MGKIDPSLSIPEFYTGQSVLITGATGFLGKALVEKLLWSCSDVREIFLIMRPKKGRSVDERLYDMLAQPMFNRLRENKPSTFSKLIPVIGDTAEEGLGLPDIERRVLIERVSIIFHVAASVRFDDDFRKAIFLNTRSARDMCILAAQMKNLIVFMHVSTAYTQTDKPIVEEKVYPAETDWKKAIKIAETVDIELLKALTPKYLGNFPNTYTCSKRLAEQVVNDYSHVIPSVIIRPSIVVSAVTEPIPGWIDNFNGPVGMLIGGGKGVVRVILGSPRITSDFIPVDLAIRAMITASWKRGIETITKNPSVHVYNCCSGMIKCVSAKELADLGLRWLPEYPLEGVIWRPSNTYITQRFLYNILVLLWHLLPALLLDTILKLSGRPPMLIKIHRKIFIANNAIAYFLLNEWRFKNDNIQNLIANDLQPGDVEDYGFNYTTFDVNCYFRQSLITAKTNLMKEDMKNLPAARKHFMRMVWLDRIFKGVLICFVTWMAFRLDIISLMISFVYQ